MKTRENAEEYKKIGFYLDPPKWILVKATTTTRIKNVLKLLLIWKEYLDQIKNWHRFEREIAFFGKDLYVVSWIGYDNAGIQNKYLQIKDIIGEKWVVNNKEVRIVNEDESWRFLVDLMRNNEIEDFKKYIKFFTDNQILSHKIKEIINNSLISKMLTWRKEIAKEFFEYFLEEKLLLPETMKEIRDSFSSKCWKEIDEKIDNCSLEEGLLPKTMEEIRDNFENREWKKVWKKTLERTDIIDILLEIFRKQEQQPIPKWSYYYKISQNAYTK